MTGGTVNTADHGFTPDHGKIPRRERRAQWERTRAHALAPGTM